MRIRVAKNIKSTLPKTESAKEFMNFVENHSQTANKSLAGTLMGTLTIIKFDVSRTMYEHVIEMIKIAAKLKSLGINVDENFMVQFIINSLTSKYSPFQMNYNTMKDKWNVNELHIMLVQEETRLKNEGTHSIHLINDQIARKKTGRKYDKDWYRMKSFQTWILPILVFMWIALKGNKPNTQRKEPQEARNFLKLYTPIYVAF
ncbi:hypothetical protein ACOSQ3_014690 [Xanthoceras sorbifolium]